MISFKIDWLDLLAVQGTLKNINYLAPQFEGISSSPLCLYGPALTSMHDYRKDRNLDCMDLISKAMSLLFTVLSRFVIAFLPRSSHLLISWLQSPSTVILQPKKRKSGIASTFYPSVYHKVMGPDAMILILVIPSFKPAFSLSFTLIKRFFSSLLSAIRLVSFAYLRWFLFLLAVLILAYNSSSLPFCMMFSVYKLNKQDDDKQPCCTPFLILNQSVVP